MPRIPRKPHHQSTSERPRKPVTARQEISLEELQKPRKPSLLNTQLHLMQIRERIRILQTAVRESSPESLDRRMYERRLEILQKKEALTKKLFDDLEKK